MHPSIKASLLAKLDQWLDIAVEDTGWPQEGMGYPELLEHMADAAEVVFDASYASSRYTIQEITP